MTENNDLINIELFKINENYSAFIVNKKCNKGTLKVIFYKEGVKIYYNEMPEYESPAYFNESYIIMDNRTILITEEPIVINNKYLDNFLKEINKLNEAYKKNLIPRVEKTKEYYYINDEFAIVKSIDLRNEKDNRRYKNYNYFITTKDATNYLIELMKFNESYFIRKDK